MPVETANVFAALGDGTRLALITRLSENGPASIVRLTHGTAMTRQAVTKHLAVLERAGLVRRSRAGRESVWATDPSGLEAAQGWLNEMSRQWDHKLEALRSFVET